MDIYSSSHRKLKRDPMRQRVSVKTTGPVHHCSHDPTLGSRELKTQADRIIGDFIGMCRTMGGGNAQAEPESERLSQRLCKLQNYRNLSSPFPPFLSPPQHATETTHTHMTDSGSWKKRTHPPLCWDVFPHCLIFQITQIRLLHDLHASNHGLIMPL